MPNRNLRSKRSGKSGTVASKQKTNKGVRKVVTEDPEESHPGRTCQVCREEDTDEMVRCDDCLKWHHFQCVGVTQEVENFPWSCTKCETAKGVQDTSSVNSVHLHINNDSSKQSFVPMIKGCPQAILPEQQQQHPSEEGKLIKAASVRPAATVEQDHKNNMNSAASVTTVQWVVSRNNARCKNTAKAPSTASNSSSQALARLQLQRLEDLRKVERREAEQQRAIAAEEARKERAFLEQKYQLLEQAISESGSVESVSENRVKNWLANPSEYQAYSLDPEVDVRSDANRRSTSVQQRGSLSAQIDSNHSTLSEPNPPEPFPEPGSLSTLSVDQDGASNQTFKVNRGLIPNDTQRNSSLGPPRRVSITQLPRSYANTKSLPPAQGLNSTQPRLSLRCDQPTLDFVPRHSVPIPDRRSRFAPNQEYLSGLNYPQAKQRNQPHSSTMRASGIYDHEQDDWDPFSISRNHLAARQAISKDLPTFSGNPEEWPLFLSTFNSTTAMCGFTNEENIVRLQRSLKGRAFEAVKCRLMHPSNVNGVLSTLKMLFGQPEVIVNSMISKIAALPALKEDKLETLVDFAVSVENFCATVDACGLEEYFYNVTFLHQLVSKLPSSIKLNWAQYRQSLPTVNLPSFSNWLYSLAEAASAVTFPSIAFEDKPARSESRTTRKGNSYVNAHSQEPPVYHRSTGPSNAKVVADCCPVCKGNCKSIAKCKRFLEFSRDSRWATVRDLGLCRRCLRQHKGGCQAKLCGRNGCQLKHHEMLHNDQKCAPSTSTATASVINTTLSTPRNDSSPPKSSSSEHGCHAHQVPSSKVLFRYIPVVLHGKHRSIQTFAFLDDGSELTLLDSELADELQLEGETMPLCLLWTSGTKRREECSRNVRLEVAAERNRSRKYSLNGVRTVKELLLPPQTLNMEELCEQYPHLRDLPITSYQNVRPRIMIGIKDQHLSLVQKSREGALHQPVAVKTRLGWTVCGGNLENTADLVHPVFHVCDHESSSELDLHKAMKEYFTIESFGASQPKKMLLSTEEERAQSLLQTHTVFKGNRYETGLLWRYENVRLPDSHFMALRRLQCLKKRMDKDPRLAEALNQKITDLATKGYARKLTNEELNQSFSRVWYLPIFPVTNINKPGKIRMVWDAAAFAHGVSLNSVLLKGPDQLCDLFNILVRFREGRIALTGDVRDMFLQIRMRSEDQQCQRFLWYDESGNIVVYVLQVMTFGACCSPSSAQFVKNLNAERFKAEYPAAVEVIQKRHYVDDMLVSVATPQEAIKLARQVKQVHAEGGFEIRNWISNSKQVMQALKEERTEEKNLDLSPELSTEKVLGMWWCTSSDTFTYKVGWNRYGRALLGGQLRPTKRQMLRVLMSMFDPLGLIAHFLMYLKVLLQDVWRSGIDWDDQINDALFEKWQTWLQVLPEVERISIPRCFLSQTTSAGYDVQLQTFVDAGDNGIAAACYLRFAQHGFVECRLVAAKTRVAPLKYLSTPKLELQAALVGARLARTVAETLAFKISRKVFWSDSQDVLCWIQSDHRRYSPFVAVRVSEILETTEMSEWRYVPTELNVADDGTKWNGVPDLTDQSRWFNSPKFVYLSEEYWPHPFKRLKTTELELRPSVLAHFVAGEPPIQVKDFSTWNRLVKVVALVKRFPNNCKLKHQKKPIVSGPLSNKELLSATSYIIRQAQQESYPDEMALLQHTQKNPEQFPTPIPKTSPIHQKSPWLDQYAILRMRGRIAACDYATEDAKHPIILSRDHHTTKLIIAHYHQKYHHQNHETVINEIRQKYSIPKLRMAYAKVRKECQHCMNDRIAPRVPIMADLPAARLDAFTRPFTHVGVDYFGPYEIVIGRRTEKRWGMLATCLTVRAIHIEVVSSLNTDSCIMALQNFVSRRGKPRVFYSDRGTNFIGARRVIKEAEDIINQEDLMKEFCDVETSWVFLPPSAPHMGGSWERLIGCVKKNLMMTLHARKLTDEVLRNLLTEVENTVNSRPLTHVPVDDDSAPALTPNHFLLGSSNGVKPLSAMDDTGSVLRQSWRLSQVQANRFWNRWVTDYLPEITRRTKWFSHTKPIEIDDVVVIVDPKSPRNCWPRGRIIGTQPGRDGRPRSATVKTTTSIYERPVAKLAVLDVRCGDG
ncbi:uncharacterized protein LOC131686265 [Topomyia yanbarensis]|uniref:uncharacterized protein LOC131686265 n=1 Tax=Topomyia yanbarensis TaxID=2498891 RepID=UPI00273B5F30|nr:uncharacterized protein LOC131686265 [Topomyia yanbarensis]